MIVTTNILAFPLVVLIWLVDTYVCLLGARMCLQHSSADWARRVTLLLREATDPVMKGVHRRLSTWRGRTVPSWVTWLSVILGALLLRHLLILLLLRMN